MNEPPFSPQMSARPPRRTRSWRSPAPHLAFCITFCAGAVVAVVLAVTAALRPPATPAAMMTLIPPPPATVEFVVSGYAPADSYGHTPAIDYGSDGDPHEASPAPINGTLTFTVPFDPAAGSYMLDVWLTATASHVTCKIAVAGPGGPRTASTVSAVSTAGELGSCNLRVTPSDDGRSWQAAPQPPPVPWPQATAATATDPAGR
jgi:hypothetical protein